MPVVGTEEFLPSGGLSHTMATSDTRNLRISPPPNGSGDSPDSAEAQPTVPEPDQNPPVDLGRIAWLGTVGVCLIVVLILVIEGYYGYAGVTFAVAVAAAINLF
jgi:hypothetical protein